MLELGKYYLNEFDVENASVYTNLALHLSQKLNFSQARVLIEDQQDVRKYIRSKLADIYTVLEAKNGREGFEMAREQIPDLVISDVMMPEMDGFELCQQLKTDDFTNHIPVILLTAVRKMLINSAPANRS